MRKYIFSFFTVLFFVGCNTEPKEQPVKVVAPEPPPPLITGMFSQYIQEADTLGITEFIGQLLAAGEAGLPPVVYGLKITETEELLRFYGQRGFKPAWITSFDSDSAFMQLNNIESDGLDPMDYSGAEVAKMLELLDEQKMDLEKWAALDIMLTHAMLKYGRHLLVGKVDPKTISETWNFPLRETPEPLGDMLLKAHNDNQLSGYFKAVRPQHMIYQGMRESLLRYRQMILDSISWPTLVLKSSKSKLEPGDTNEIVPLLTKRLFAEGYIDTIINDSTLIYSPELAGSLAQFQIAHGLHPDSIAGKSTFALLNISIEDRVDAIIVNMERARWVVGNLGGSYILVNTAQYHLWLFQNDTISWDTKVIIGAPFNATPFFTANLQRVVFNPTWTVPYSIATKEMLPKLRTNANYLARQNMVLLNRQGEKVDPSTINFNQYTTRNFPFIIRQEPGDKNALGHVKFDLPNPYSIYLHDTPTRNLFNKDERAMSHGCIRVNNPLTLAELLLQNKEGWRNDTIPAILETKKTTIVKLDEGIPVLLLYMTHYTNAQGRAMFFKDIYNSDKKLLAAIRKKDATPIPI
jgi:murein L,D-transpeptidase YcbB/YkuD